MGLPPPDRAPAPWPPPRPTAVVAATDVRSRPRGRFSPFHALVVSVVAVALTVGAVAVRVVAGDTGRPTTDAPSAASSSTSTASSGATPLAWDPRIAPLARFVEQERGRPFKRSVPVRFLDDDRFLAEMAADDEPLTDDDVEYYASIDRALGWIGAGLDTEAAWTELVEDGVAAYYEPGVRRIVMRGVPGDGPLSVELRVVLVHELTHAWQDQHMGLDAVIDDAEGDLAWSAVVEGDAMRVESAYAATLLAAEQAQWLAFEDARRSELLLTDAAPVMYDLDLTAPYLVGERLIDALDARGDDAGVDRVLDQPPVSSEQAMFAALADGDHPIVEVDPGDEPDGATWMDERPIGAWDVFTTLVTRVDGRTAVEAARAWAGGWETVYEAADGTTCVRWRVATDDELGYEALRAAFGGWATAGAAGAAQVSGEQTEGLVELEACDPADRAVAPNPAAVYDAVAWLLAHEAVVAGLARDMPLASADCAATRLLASLAPSAISYGGLGAERAGLVSAAGAYREACRGVLSVDG